MADQTGSPTYDELMKENIQLKEKAVRITSEAERREERLAAERDEACARAAEWEAHHARLVEDTESTVRRFSAALDERDAARQQCTLLLGAIHANGGTVTTEEGRVTAVTMPAQREQIGYAVTIVDSYGPYIHTGRPMPTYEHARDRAGMFQHCDARVVELREVADRG